MTTSPVNTKLDHILEFARSNTSGAETTFVRKLRRSPALLDKGAKVATRPSSGLLCSLVVCKRHNLRRLAVGLCESSNNLVAGRLEVDDGVDAASELSRRELDKLRNGTGEVWDSGDGESAVQ